MTSPGAASDATERVLVTGAQGLLGRQVVAALLDAGVRWCFVSNADNLGARPDARLAAWVAAEGVPFAMEAVRGTPADRKGGHLASYRGRTVLRETAQVPPGDDSFTDVERWRWYNTNNLWIDLEALRRQLAQARVIYSATNPTLRLLETRVAGLEAIVAEQRAALGDDPGMSEYEAALAERLVQAAARLLLDHLVVDLRAGGPAVGGHERAADDPAGCRGNDRLVEFDAQSRHRVPHVDGKILDVGADRKILFFG